MKIKTIDSIAIIRIAIEVGLESRGVEFKDFQV